MGFKKIDQKIGFAELALASSMEKNRSLQTLEQLNKVINWSKIEKILLKHHKIGKSKEGADAYPPLMLFKCMLLQKEILSNVVYGIRQRSDLLQYRQQILLL